MPNPCPPGAEKSRPGGAGAPVPQTDAGGLVEHTEASGRTTVKELGKIAP